MENNEKFNLYIPISKIDKENRTVFGIASSEMVDKQNEVVDYEASKEAFSKFSGAIREMHEPKAVGKAIEIIPDDKERKVWVKAYVSKGAEDTWIKLQEGILKGFSIGGRTLQKSVKSVKNGDTGESKAVTYITKYSLSELSLVDNPANPECTLEMVKSVDGVPYQTSLVEDISKVIVTEAIDPLENEIKLHRDKADSLVKKVLSKDDLEKLADDDFAIIRKHTSDNTITKERIIPMPDKVHAVRALEILKDYGLNEEEKALVHAKAKDILGSAYEAHANLNREGEDKVSNEKFDKINEAIGDLAKRLDEIVSSLNVLKTPTITTTSEATTGELKTEEVAEAEKSEKVEDVKKAEEVVEEEVELTEEEKKAKEEEEAKKKAEAEAEAEKASKAEDIKKAESEKIEKLESNIESLRKQLSEVTDLLKKPMPRKVAKIEKNLDTDVPSKEDSQFDKDMVRLSELRNLGEGDSAEARKLADSLSTRSLTKKFAKYAK